MPVTVATSWSSVIRTRQWVEDNPRLVSRVQEDAELLVLMMELGLGREATSPVVRFLVRTASAVPHAPLRPVLDVLAGFRLRVDGADPIATALKDMARIARGDLGERMKIRLAHQAGGKGCDLLGLALLLHAVAEPHGSHEVPSDSVDIIVAQAGRAWAVRRRLEAEEGIDERDHAD